MTIAALAILASLTTSADEPTAGPLISKMFSHYASANSLRGTIKMTQTAQGQSLTILSEVQFAKPSKVYIRQQKNGADPKTWLVVSDGTRFAYDRPEGVLGLKDRFIDPVSSVNGSGRLVTLDYKDIYLAASKSLGSKPPPLDIIFGRNDDLRVLIALWGKMTLAGKTTVKGKELNVVHGGFRESFNGRLVGNVEMLISDDGDLYSFRTTETVAVPGGNAPINIETVMDCDFAYNGEPVESLFTAIK